MKQLSYYLKPALVFLLGLVVAGGVMACGVAPAVPTPLPTPEDVQVAVVPPPTPTTPATPTPPPAILAPDDGCVTCHTDQEMLIATASEEEAGHEELSEGEG
jgi:hypothetical protein